MIQSKKDYIYYLKCDATAHNRKNLRTKFLGGDTWNFQKSMRRLEYYTNCKKGLIYIPYKMILKYQFYRKSIKIGVEIPINTCGPGLAIPHRGQIIINPATKIGANCRIHSGVNIGTAAGFDDHAPIIGDNCYIGPGAKLFGKIIIGNDVAIGANSVVNKNFKKDKITIAGVPAVIVNTKGSVGILKKSTEII